MDTAREEKFERDDDTDTSFTSLENHLFGVRYFEDYGAIVDEVGKDQTTMLHKSASAADTVVQRSLNVPPPTQVVTVLPPGTRPTDRATPAPTHPSRGGGAGGGSSNAGNLAAAGGVFAGVSMVAAGSLVALGIVCAVAIYLLLTGDDPGTDARPAAPRVEAPVAPQPTPAVPDAPPERVGAPVPPPAPAPTDDPVLAELRVGVRFPAAFQFNDWRPMDLDDAVLAQLVEDLGHCPDRIRVTGHADYKGTEMANDTFALARAGEVRKLLGQQGLDKKRIEIASAGADEPEADVKSPEGRAENRRVVISCN